jgi:hypothetical protein
MKRTWIIGIVATILFANAVFMVYLRKSRTVLLDFQKPYNEVVDERIGRQVDILRLQSLNESLAMLDRMEHYNWPGASIGAGEIRVHNDAGRYKDNIDKQNIVLSSRVFRKCIQEIKLIPQKEAIRLIETHLDNALLAYTNAYEFGASPTLASDKDGKPVLKGIRYKVFALLLIAGMCEFTENHVMVRKVAEFAFDQKTRGLKRISEIDYPNPHVASFAQFVYLTDTSLWNPYILSAGLYGTHPRRNSPEFKKFADRLTEHSLVDYTANRTEFDDHFGMEVVPDRGYIKIRLFKSATDEDVLTLLGI